MNPTKAAILTVLLLICVPYFALAVESGKLSVNGSATLYIEPDFVTATFTVERNAVLAVDANQEVGQTMKRLLEVARGKDIPDVDLKTSGITISVVRTNRNDCPSSDNIRAWQSLTVVLRKLDQVESLIDEMVEAGALIQRVQPGVDDMETHKKRALELAIDSAREQAGTVAEQLGLVMGSAIEVSFASAAMQYQTAGFSTTERLSARTYLPGMIRVSESVRVVFESSDNQ